VLTASIDDFQVSEDEIFDIAYENFFKTGTIKCDERESDNGDKMIHLHHSDGLVTALLGDQVSYENFSEMVNSQDIAVAILSPDDLLITASGSIFEPEVCRLVAESKEREESFDIDLEPSVYRWSIGENGSVATLSRLL
jgi:hypothetical protein